MSRPYEQTASRPHTCKFSEFDPDYCTDGTIDPGDAVVPYEDGVAHYDCVDVRFYSQRVATGNHPGPADGV